MSISKGKRKYLVDIYNELEALRRSPFLRQCLQRVVAMSETDRERMASIIRDHVVDGILGIEGVANGS